MSRQKAAMSSKGPVLSTLDHDPLCCPSAMPEDGLRQPSHKRSQKWPTLGQAQSTARIRRIDPLLPLVLADPDDHP
ncbi:MAG: hypothetical protein Q8L92_00215, partial [Rubrivivax sp.]|nr:hypothetical protein [Rubrivivax sp.]